MSAASFSLKIETSPSPATIVFRFSGLEAFVDQPVEYPSVAETDSSPLAAKIFGFPWTQSVLVGTDFVSVTKQDWVEWKHLAEPLADMVQEHLRQGLPVYVEDAGTETTDQNAPQPDDSELIREIKKVLNKEIRPVLAFDGGDLLFADFSNHQLRLKFKGACAGCPSKSVTLKEGIEVRMKELFPEIHEVIGV